MRLSDDIKAKIQAEFNQWKDSQYSDKSLKERQKLGQFFTPPQLSIQMLEKFEDLAGDILDPTAGAGGLLAAAVIAGADPKRCYGIELDPQTALLCRERLAKLGVPRSNIKVGDALEKDSYSFEEPASTEIYFRVEDLGFSKVKIFLEVNAKKSLSQREFVIDFSEKEETIRKKFEKLYNVFKLVDGEKVKLYSEKLEGRLKFMDAFFRKHVGRASGLSKRGLVEI